MEKLQSLWEEARDLTVGKIPQIPRLESPPQPLQFLRDFVLPNKPFILSNSISHWPALSLWPTNPSHLSSSLPPQSFVSLHLTPTGRADSLVESPSNSLVFASPHVEHVPLSRALDLVINKAPNLVAYLQEQNDCFRKEYCPGLGSDCEGDIPWATEALASLPEAVNLWIGNEESVTSFHKDHYENLYAVVSGEKHFLLLPPTEVHRMYVRDYPAARYSYSQETGEFCLELEQPVRYVPWCSVDPYPSPENEKREMLKFPLYFNGPKPIHCTVKAGEILYLPSLWFHHVRQTPNEHGCAIAINYWYDMQFDMKYAYFNFVQSLNFESRLMGTRCEHQGCDLFDRKLESDDYSDAEVGDVIKGNQCTEDE